MSAFSEQFSVNKLENNQKLRDKLKNNETKREAIKKMIENSKDWKHIDKNIKILHKQVFGKKIKNIFKTENSINKEKNKKEKNKEIKETKEKINFPEIFTNEKVYKQCLEKYGNKRLKTYLRLISKLKGKQKIESLKKFDNLVDKAIIDTNQNLKDKKVMSNPKRREKLRKAINSDSNYRDKLASNIANGNIPQGTPKNIDLSNLPKGIKGLLEFIAKAENGSVNYNAIFGKEKSSQPFSKPLSEMTVKQVIQAQKQYKKAHGYKSAAIGAYQFMDYTLESMAKSGKINLNDKFTNEFQDKIATIKLKERGLDSFMSGKITRDQFQVKLSQEWASLPKNESGASYYSGDGLNKALVSNNQLDKVLDSLKNSA